MANIKTLIVDDHDIVRDGLKTLLDKHPGLEISGEVSNGKDAVEFCKSHPVDLVLMDIHMPVMDGIEATRLIRKMSDRTKVLALTMSDDDLHIRNMIHAGVSGYILKNSGRTELKKAIEQIMDGKHFFSDQATERVMMELVRNRGEIHSQNPVELTKREKEVLVLIVEENTNQEIADLLSVSVRTIDAHRRNLLQKTGVRNTAGLVRYGLEHGLYKPGSGSA